MYKPLALLPPCQQQERNVALDICGERLELGKLLDSLDGSATLRLLRTASIVASRAIVMMAQHIRILTQLGAHIVPPEIVEIAIVIVILVHLHIDEVANIVIEFVVTIVVGIRIIVRIAPGCVAGHL